MKEELTLLNRMINKVNGVKILTQLNNSGSMSFQQFANLFFNQTVFKVFVKVLPRTGGLFGIVTVGGQC